MNPPSSTPHNFLKERRFMGNLGTRFPLNLGLQAKFWSRIMHRLSERSVHARTPDDEKRISSTVS